jgi:8-oxo-dGTP pyrophosphatase MutT (NUDIX family)
VTLGRDHAATTRSERVSMLGAEVLFHGTLFDVVRVPVDTRPGPRTYEFVVCNDVVRVYPFDSTGTLWLIDEVKPGISAGRLLRAVSGSVEAGETAEAAAQRELEEELGVNARSCIYLRVSTPVPKVLHNVHHIVAFDIQEPASRRGRASPSEEDIRPHPVPPGSLESLAMTGMITEDPVALSLLHLGRAIRTHGMQGLESVDTIPGVDYQD